MAYYLLCVYPWKVSKVDANPYYVGRALNPGREGRTVPLPCLSSFQFRLSRTGFFGLLYENLSRNSPATVDGVVELSAHKLFTKGDRAVIEAGGTVFFLGNDPEQLIQNARVYGQDRYIVNLNGQDTAPLAINDILTCCQSGEFHPDTPLFPLLNPGMKMTMRDLVDFGEGASSAANTPGDGPVPVAQMSSARHQTAEEIEPVKGESFRCPYCRTVSKLEDILSVSVSPGLLGDEVLGAAEQRRFLPASFTANGLALDAEGGVCTEVACPHCHMVLPSAMLESRQIVFLVIGAAGAGKSVFLASSIWQCRHLLAKHFGVSFMDLDPVANRWINAYEEKLFFQQDNTALQQIEKTDLQARNVSRSILINGENLLVPLPSFFQVRPRSATESQSLVVYDSAGEHFRAGADTQDSIVTLNMLHADVLYFLFDPSADPRFASRVRIEEGAARNYAQRQDILLAEVAARIRRHLGNRSEARIRQPLVVGVSKADLLAGSLPLEAPVYVSGKGGERLDLGVLKDVSRRTEALLKEVVPEVVATAREIATEVWFLPMSALGHNPKREGVRPCDIHPIWSELPIAFALARAGLVPVVGDFRQEEKGHV